MYLTWTLRDPNIKDLNRIEIESIDFFFNMIPHTAYPTAGIESLEPALCNKVMGLRKHCSIAITS